MGKRSQLGSRRGFLGAVALGVAPAPAIASPGRGGRAPGAYAGIFDVTRFGAVGDGRTLVTAGLQKAIDACAAAGGGLVLVPPGQYLTGALFLRSHVHLHIEAGATLLASQRFQDFPPIDSRSEGIERKCYASLLTGLDLENVTITGRGVLDGQGPPWWAAHETTRNMRLARRLPREAENPAGAPLKWPRPRVINLVKCERVLVSGLTVTNGPCWNFHFVYCQDLVVDGVSMTGLQAEHIDGIIVDSCKNVRISNCCLGSGSECIGLKSGYNEDGRRVGIPCEDVVITNCHLFFSFGAAIAIGSETAAGIRNVSISNSTITSCRNAIHVRAPRGRGGVVERIRASNLVIGKVDEAALLVSHFYDSVRMGSFFGEGPSPKGNPETDRELKLPAGEGTPTFRDLVFSGISLGECADVAVVEGLPERFIESVTFDHVEAKQAGGGISFRRARDVTIEAFTVDPREGAAVAARDVEGLEVYRLKSRRPATRTPLVQLDAVAGALVHGCQVPRTGGAFVQQQGTRNRDVDVVDPKRR
jgi:polygalacturonase